MRRIFALAILTLLSISVQCSAHPADAFCGSDSLIDPALCQELVSIDSVNTGWQSSDTARMTVFADVAHVYFRLGWNHVFPGGLDHILFVLAIFLVTRGIRRAIAMVSIFTLSHAITVALAVAGVVNWSGPWLEAAIALTIFWAGVECITLDKPAPWQAVIVFGFGLIHGLGLAGAIAEQGMPEGQFIAAFFAFNVGIELAQVLCGLAGFVVITALGYAVKYPKQKLGGFIIAVFGFVWMIERILLAIS